MKNVKKLLIGSLSAIGLMASSLAIASNVTSNYCRQCKENEFSFQLPACCETGLYCDIDSCAYTTTKLNVVSSKGFEKDNGLYKQLAEVVLDNDDSAVKMSDYQNILEKK